MVNRFQTFDGDANLFSGQNKDGDKFILLRKFSDYESDSTFLFVENTSNIHKTIQTSDGEDSIVLTDAYGMDIKFIGTPDHINSLFQRVPDPLFERIEEQKEPEPIIEYVQTPGPKGEQGYAGADGVDFIVNATVSSSSWKKVSGVPDALILHVIPPADAPE